MFNPAASAPDANPRTTKSGSCNPLAVVEGATENTTTVTDLLVGLGDRGLDVTQPILVVIDGAKALRSAVETVFDCPVVAAASSTRSAASSPSCPIGWPRRSARRCAPPTS